MTRRYGRKTVLDHVSFSIRPGQVVALLGGNGAGKTTTLKCILGVIGCEGVVRVGGLRIDKQGREARALMGYVPQLPALAEDDSCGGALAFAAELRGVPKTRVPEALAAVNLAEHGDTRVGELSGGMRQRLALAAALLGDPPLLLLDEPTASLDAESRAQFEQIIRRLRDAGRTILLSTHAHGGLDELVDRILILRDGALAFDGDMAALTKRFHLNRYVVNLNGNAPSAFLQALTAAGIAEERVGRAPVPWDEVMLGIAGEGTGAS
ncbi:MAG TPA: ABC transporter ATP-binding protein [Rhodanobacteraceae bacterium]|nr:ABC transporter ATP-binding protein [Rhodanobacteraceae bacterium]